MPYIPADERRHYEAGINLIVNRLSQRDFHPGHVTYVLYAIAVQSMRALGKSYNNLSRIRASINDTSDEFYRAEMAPYEEMKIRENGPV